jgi:hypothetical protein
VRRQTLKNEPNIYRREANRFCGWIVQVDRGALQWTRPFSDGRGGPLAALRRARAFRRQLVERLPWRSKVKTKHVLNRTGTIGVWRARKRIQAGGWLTRWVAAWPLREGGTRTANFSVRLYGEEEARRRAIEARRRGLEVLLRPAKPGHSIAALGAGRPRRP